jgi:hypothetical protein
MIVYSLYGFVRLIYLNNILSNPVGKSSAMSPSSLELWSSLNSIGWWIVISFHSNAWHLGHNQQIRSSAALYREIQNINSCGDTAATPFDPDAEFACLVGCSQHFRLDIKIQFWKIKIRSTSGQSILFNIWWLILVILFVSSHDVYT